MSDRVPDLHLDLERIQELLEAEKYDEALDLFKDLAVGDQVEVFNNLNEDQQIEVVRRLGAEATAELFNRLTDAQAVEAAEGLPTAQLSEILDEMQPDQVADILGDLPEEQANAALQQMEDPEDVIPLLGYPDETAGGRMTTEFIAMRRHTKAGQAIEFLREVSPDHEVPYYIFVVDRERRLSGVVGMRELVVASPDKLVEDLMNPDVVYVTAGTDQEEVVRVMDNHNLSAIPVVDDNQHMLGVITHDDVIDVLKEEAGEDILQLGGVEPGPLLDIPYWSQKISQVVRSRFTWLLTLFVAETLTGTVMRHFDEELKTVVALSFFVPLLIGTGGNAGSQTVATVIRGMALGEVKRSDILWVWWREFRTGVALGLLLGLVGYGRALLWGVDGHMALTVGITIAFICAWANSVAALVPLIADKAGIDPTIISGPLMSTFIDATGLVIYFSLAALILPQL
jgi:magnesium transporter